MMAPTKANAMYAATMLSLLSRGLAKSIGETPSVHNAARINVKASKGFQAEKAVLLSGSLFAAMPHCDARLK